MFEEPEKYQSIFDIIPIPIWVEDFSEVKSYLISLGLVGLSEEEIRMYLQDNLKIVNNCISKFRILSLNHACVELHKAKSKDDLLENIHNIFSLESLDAFIDQLVYICKEKYSYEGKAIVKTLTNEPIIVLVKSKVLTGYESCLSKVLVSTEDITKTVNSIEHKNNIALQQSNERFIYASQAISDAIWDWNISKGEVFWSSGYYTLFGHKPGLRQEKEDVWEENIHPKDYLKIKASLDTAKSNPNQLKWNSTYRFRKSDGTYAYVSEHSLILRDKNGKAIRMIGALQDITRRKKSEKSIVQKSKFLKIIANLVEAMLTYESWESVLARNLKVIGESADVDRAYLLANHTMKHSSKLCTKKLYVWCKSDDEIDDNLNTETLLSLDENPVLYRNALEKAPFYTHKSSVKTQNLWDYMEANQIVSILLIPIHSKNTLYGFLGFDSCTKEREWTKDLISFLQTIANNFGNAIEKEDFELSLQKLNNQLKDSNKELEISNSELEQFAFVASHDLQEPLRMITSFLTLLEKKYSNQIDDKGKLYIKYAVDGAFQMKQIILDLLEFSRVGSKSNFEISKFEAKSAVNETCDLLASKILESNAKITLGNLPIIQTNKSAFKQLIQNLLSNSLKYTYNDITPVIHIESKDLGSFWEFSIEDNGIGISPEYHSKIFNVFQRLHDKTTYSGTGIGLAICKKIANLIGGDIYLESAVGRGSKFYFTIPKSK
ncbi:ATP-binding protein [Belliella kenyensis]|uniref:histidine kinase n=1 Tax=Belliella kenyensis TaxID=1472724 RepID=A0ABV8ELL2_9BACT|nr:ATP-binding protein [Belliella kenyensis]MCH7403534.1 ATP-binding protein [Belliella kenyensis]MDN3604944.1 ATP-binding protein [Belliella kenyensis]